MGDYAKFCVTAEQMERAKDVSVFEEAEADPAKQFVGCEHESELKSHLQRCPECGMPRTMDLRTGEAG